VTFAIRIGHNGGDRLYQREGTRISAQDTGDITGVILVGGKSSRMGRDKAFLELGGKTLLAGIVALFQECFDRVVLCGDRPERFAGYGLPVLPDIRPGGALGGIYTGLCHAETEHVFVSSCDLPFPSSAILRYLCSLKDGHDVVVPATAHGYEPLFAVYSKRCLEPIRVLLDRGDFCAYGYYPEVRVRYVRHEELAHLDGDGRAFLNVNTPEEFAKAGGEL
jgi:molybdenum cofactor guanylyltransferase